MPNGNLVTIVPTNEYGGADEIKMCDIPDNPGNGSDVAYEMSRIAQKAYDMGRRHQMEIHERELNVMLRAIRKGLKS